MRFELLDEVVAVKGMNRGVKGQVIALACDRDGTLVEVTTLHTDGPISYTCVNLPETLVRVVDDRFPRRPPPLRPSEPPRCTTPKSESSIVMDVMLGWALLFVMFGAAAIAIYSSMK